MKKSIKGTQTEKNLLAAFAGESQAKNRYTFFASQARKEGYVQIADIFAETAANEKEHAEVFFEYLQGGDVEITASYPAGIISDTRKSKALLMGRKWNGKSSMPRQKKLPGKKGLKISQFLLRKMPKSKSFMKKDTVNWLKISKTVLCSSVINRLNGIAQTVVIYMRAQRRLMNARPASIPNLTISCWLKTTKQKMQIKPCVCRALFFLKSGGVCRKCSRSPFQKRSVKIC